VAERSGFGSDEQVKLAIAPNGCVCGKDQTESKPTFLKAFLLCLSFLSVLNQTRAAVGQAQSSLAETETVVTPLATEDIAGPFHYSLRYSKANRRIRGVWLIFNRGRDVHDLASDPDVLAFARHFDLALLMQNHCPGKLPANHEDMNMEPAEGLGAITPPGSKSVCTGHETPGTIEGISHPLRFFWCWTAQRTIYRRVSQLNPCRNSLGSRPLPASRHQHRRHEP
jgi:hypothetical protein